MVPEQQFSSNWSRKPELSSEAWMQSPRAAGDDSVDLIHLHWAVWYSARPGGKPGSSPAAAGSHRLQRALPAQPGNSVTNRARHQFVQWMEPFFPTSYSNILFKALPFGFLSASVMFRLSPIELGSEVTPLTAALSTMPNLHFNGEGQLFFQRNSNHHPLKKILKKKENP